MYRILQLKTTVHIPLASSLARALSMLAASPSNYRSGIQPVRSASVPSPDPTIVVPLVPFSFTIQHRVTHTILYPIGWAMHALWLVRVSSYCWWATRKISRRRVKSRSWRRVILHRNTVCALWSVLLDRINSYNLNFNILVCEELIFLETSAKTGDSVEEAFLKCSKTILAKIETGELDPENIGSGIQYGDAALRGLQKNTRPGASRTRDCCKM